MIHHALAITLTINNHKCINVASVFTPGTMRQCSVLSAWQQRSRVERGTGETLRAHKTGLRDGSSMKTRFAVVIGEPTLSWLRWHISFQYCAPIRFVWSPTFSAALRVRRECEMRKKRGWPEWVTRPAGFQRRKKELKVSAVKWGYLPRLKRAWDHED